MEEVKCHDTDYRRRSGQPKPPHDRDNHDAQRIDNAQGVLGGQDLERVQDEGLPRDKRRAHHQTQPERRGRRRRE